MSEIQYKRLTRPGAGGGSAAFFSRGSLWLGQDHLLSVVSSGFTESYKRFYFRDIQAFVVQKTRTFQVLNIIIVILALIVLIFLLSFLSAAAPSPWTYRLIVLGIVAGLFGAFLALNLIAGQTCRTFLRTAVQIEELPSLTRVKKTRRALAELHPLIVAAQGGELSPETVAAQMREWTAPVSTATATTARTESVVDDTNVPPRLNP